MPFPFDMPSGCEDVDKLRLLSSAVSTIDHWRAEGDRAEEGMTEGGGAGETERGPDDRTQA